MPGVVAESSCADVRKDVAEITDTRGGCVSEYLRWVIMLEVEPEHSALFIGEFHRWEVNP